MIARLLCRVLDAVTPIAWWLAHVVLWIVAVMIVVGVVR